MSMIQASQLSDLIRASVSTLAATQPSKGEPVFVVICAVTRGIDSSVAHEKEIVVVRFYTGRNKALERESLTDIIVGYDVLIEGAPLSAFAFDGHPIFNVAASYTPYKGHSHPFEGVFSLKAIDIVEPK